MKRCFLPNQPTGSRVRTVLLSLFILPAIFLATHPAHAQAGAKMISGKVTDEAGEALIGANILLKGKSAGTVTELDGNF